MNDREFEAKLQVRQDILEQSKAKKRLFKFTLFFVVLIFYIFLLLEGWARNFILPSELILLTSRSGGGFLPVLILGTFFIWLPDGGIGFIENLFTAGRGKSIHPFAFRIFGWVIFLVPAMIMLGYYLIK